MLKTGQSRISCSNYKLNTLTRNRINLPLPEVKTGERESVCKYDAKKSYPTKELSRRNRNRVITSTSHIGHFLPRRESSRALVIIFFFEPLSNAIDEIARLDHLGVKVRSSDSIKCVKSSWGTFRRESYIHDHDLRKRSHKRPELPGVRRVTDRHPLRLRDTKS